MNRDAINLFRISTNLRVAYLWVNGYERSAGVAYYRRQGEIIHSITRIGA